MLVLCASDPNPQLQLHEVPRDGNCLFSAVALSQSIVDGGAATMAAELRKAAMDLLCPVGDADPKLMLGGLPAAMLIEPLQGETPRQYCHRLRKDGEWGSTAELLALTRVLRRPIVVHAAFGSDTYGSEEGTERKPLVIHFHQHHYRAATSIDRLRGGGGGAADGGEEAAACDGRDAEMASVGAVLDAMHAASSRADAAAYFRHFRDDAVFLGTAPEERWPMDLFRPYATARFDAGDGWTYDVVERHVHVRGSVAWFDESLRNAKLGPCRGSGVLIRDGNEHASAADSTLSAADASAPTRGWRLVQYNLMMAISNDVALEVAELGRRRRQ